MFQINFPDWDTELFNLLNGLHAPWLDPVMITLSSGFSWLVLFIIVSYCMLRQSKIWGFREIILITITVCINSLLNNLAKFIIQRPRPCHDELINPTIRILEDCGTHYSFFSAHSSNAFCLAVCTAIFFKNKYYSIFIITWATIVAYSRIYVGKHYPLDVLVGVIFGISMSIAGNYFLKQYREQNPLNT